MMTVVTTLAGSTFTDLESFSGRFAFDIRYARDDNFLGRAVYTEPGAYLQKEPAEALLHAADQLATHGAGILIFDAFRPWSVTKVFWDESPEASRKFLANPDFGSVHNRGCAVDCGLYDLKTGHPLVMPSDFDEFSPRAFSDYAGGTFEETQNRELLFKAMREAGFRTIPHEWWHFNHPAAADYPIYDLSFSELKRSTRPADSA